MDSIGSPGVEQKKIKPISLNRKEKDTKKGLANNKKEIVFSIRLSLNLSMPVAEEFLLIYKKAPRG